MIKKKYIIKKRKRKAISKSKFGGNRNAYIIVFVELMFMVLLATVSVKYHTVLTTGEKKQVKAALKTETEVA